jgi:hypothetical protein
MTTPIATSSSSELPISTERRRVNYLRQTGRAGLTPRQRRRVGKKMGALRHRPPPRS